MNILRPLSPHLPIYKPQLTSTFPISHRISGAFLATIVLFFYLLCLKIGLICFTYDNFYQFFFYSSKFILIPVEITALALSYHLYNGLRLLLLSFFMKMKLPLPPFFSMCTHMREIPFRRDLFSKWVPFILSKILPPLLIDLLFLLFYLYLEKMGSKKGVFARFINLLYPKPLVRATGCCKDTRRIKKKITLFENFEFLIKDASCRKLKEFLEKNGINFPEKISVSLLDSFLRTLETKNPEETQRLPSRVYQNLIAFEDQEKGEYYKEFILFIKKEYKLIFIYKKLKGEKLGAA